jgi:predicted porin
MLSVVSTLGSGATTLVRANNTVGYFLPAAGGLYGQVQIAAGEGVAGNKYTGFRIGYAGGPVNIAGALGKTAKDGSPPLADDYTDKNIGGSFRIGSAFTLYAQYSQRDFLNRDQKTYLVGGTLGFGASTLKASYVQSKGTQGSNARDFDAKLIGLGYQYDLSKRTALYGTYGNLDNDGNAATGSTFTIGSGPAQTAGGAKSSGFALGVRHSF